MAKGHLHQERANVQSTKPKPPPESPLPLDPSIIEDFSPTTVTPPEPRSHAVYADCEPVSGRVYADGTGRFMAPSATGHEYIFIVYDYDSNSIHATPIKNRTAGEFKRAYVATVELLQARGLQPKLHFLDNEASKQLKNYITDQGGDFHLAPPYLHRRNAAERAISTYKDHFIAGLCSTDKNYPLTS